MSSSNWSLLMVSVTDKLDGFCFINKGYLNSVAIFCTNSIDGHCQRRGAGDVLGIDSHCIFLEKFKIHSVAEVVKYS